MNSPVDWKKYYEKRSTNPVSKPLVLALDLFAAGQITAPRFAIDLGCGAGTDTLHLMQNDWSVLAIDNEARAIDYVKQMTSSNHRLLTQQDSFEHITSLPACLLINACYSLHYLIAEKFQSFWNIITTALMAGGRFAGILLGKNDEWNNKRPMTFLCRTECMELFNAFDIEVFEEIEHDRPLVNGTLKHWHIYLIVAKKR